jgi:hypothetical protein
MDSARAPALGAEARGELEAAFRQMHTLEDVVRWGLGSDPPRPIVEVVAQDEYTHDVVVEVSAGDCYAVFDTT